jgi:EmrB/QacA subfamily drug resistance transporter
MSEGGADGRGERRRWPVVYIGLLATFMTLLDVSIVNVALPTIEKSLRATSGELQWILSGYALTFGLVLVSAGRVGDARGRRAVLVGGLAAFTLSSALAGAATSPAWLIAARLLQGAAAGVINPQVFGLIQELFRPADRGRPFGMLGTVVGISTAIGPLLGGALIALGGERDGWRWIFYVNVPIGILAVLLALRVIPRQRRDRPGERDLDPVGVLLLGLGIVLVLLPLVQERQWRGATKWLLIPAGLLVLVAFVAWERRYRRHAEPLFNLDLLRLRSYALGSTIALLYFAGFTAIFFIYSLYLQFGLGYDALVTGALITPFALGSGLAAAVGGRLVARVGRPLVAVGLALVAVGLTAVVVTLHFLPGPSGPPVLVGPLLLAGIGSGLAISPNQTLTVSQVPVSEAGSAGGMLQTAQRIGSACGIAGVGSVFFGTLARTHDGWSRAFRDALLVAIGFVVLALVAAVIDSAAERRARHPDHQGQRVT